MISFLSQIFKSTDNAVKVIDADEMGLSRLTQMKDRSHESEEGHHKDLLDRVKSAEVGSHATQLRFRKQEVKAPVRSGWDALRI